MTAKRNYSRYFIILQEDERGYSVDPNKFPTGYAKVERKNNKCKVSYYVQNLKKSNDSYCMVLICDRKKDKRLVKLGEINIDDYGRAEVSYEYDINNIANCNIPMDNIKGASIVRIKDSNVHGILTGFVSGDKLDDWKSYVIIEGEDRCEKEENEEKSKVKESVKEKVEVNAEVNSESEENIFDKYESDIEKHKESAKENEKELRDIKEDDTREAEVVEELKNLENKEEKIEENTEENIDTIENIEEINDDKLRNEKDNNREENTENITSDIKEKVKEEKEIEIEEKLEEVEEKIQIDENDIRKCDCDCDCEDKKKSKDKKEEKKKDKEKDKQKDKYKNKDKNKNCPYEEYCHMNWEKEYYKHIVEGLKEEKGVCEELGKCQWYKIDYMDLIQMKPGMDFSKYSMIYYPMVNYVSYIMRKGHYLMGFKYDKEGKMKYLVYGIPGTKSIVDQPFNGATGFVTWVPAYANKDKDNNGYWVMFYDFKKCTVVIPVKK